MLQKILYAAFIYLSGLLAFLLIVPPSTFTVAAMYIAFYSAVFIGIASVLSKLRFQMSASIKRGGQIILGLLALPPWIFAGQLLLTQSQRYDRNAVEACELLKPLDAQADTAEAYTQKLNGWLTSCADNWKMCEALGLATSFSIDYRSVLGPGGALLVESCAAGYADSCVRLGVLVSNLKVKPEIHGERIRNICLQRKPHI